MSGPAQYMASITVDSVIEQLGAFIQPFVGGAQIVRAEVNRVAPPNGSFVELTELGQTDLSYPRMWYSDTSLQTNIVGPKCLTVQADFYGPLSGDWCAAVKQAFRSAYGARQFSAGVAPLYTDDGRQAPLVSGEQQYIRRWVLTMALQYNPVIVMDWQSADELKMALVEDAK